MSFSKSCSCSDFVAVEITTRRPLRIAGIRYASVLPVPVPASTIRCRFSLESGFHQFRHLQLRRPVLVAFGHAFFERAAGAENFGNCGFRSDQPRRNRLAPGSGCADGAATACAYFFGAFGHWEKANHSRQDFPVIIPGRPREE